MRFKSMTVAAAALSIIATPALAATANPAASLSVAKSVRAPSPSAKSSKLSGDAVIPAVLIAATIAGGIILAVSEKNPNAKSN